MEDSDNVHWLQPLQPTTARDLFLPGGATVDFYEARSGELMTLAQQLRRKPAPENQTTWWVSETAHNDFPRLPVFQHANPLVAISACPTEPERGEGSQLPAPHDVVPKTATGHHRLVLRALP